MDNLTIDTAQVEQPTLTIDQGTAPAQPPNDTVAKTRAYKAHMGIGDIIKQDYDQIYRNIADGQEDAIRKDAALTITANAMQQRQKALVELAARKGRALTLEDVNSFEAAPADPKSVIEQGYSRAYVNTLHDASNRIEDNILTDAQAQNPEAVQRYFNKGSDVLSKREYAATEAQNLQPLIEKNSWFSFPDPRTDNERIHVGSYDVKQLLSLGFYESAVLRGNTKGTSRIGFLGNVLEAQANELKQLPFEQFQREFDSIITNLKTYDPVLAQKFAHAVSGLTDSDKIIYNVTEAANVVLAATAGISGRQVAKNIGEAQVKNLGNLGKGADGVYRPAGPTEPPSGGGGIAAPVPRITSDDLGRGAMSAQEVLRQSPNPQVAKAVDDVVKSAGVPEVTKATIAEGAGDVKEAAVQKAVTSITRPDPIKDGVNTLLSLHRADTNELYRTETNLSRENHTRLLDAAAGFERGTIDVLTNTSQVVRTPLLMEDGFRGIADKIRTYFPGRENTIADIDMRVQELGPLTIHADVKIVNYDGTPFSSYELAANHARINGYPLQGIEGKLGDKVYLPVTAAKNLESVKTTPEGTKFFIDKDIEVLASPNPIPGHIPYNLKTGKFEKALTEETARIEQQGLGFHIIVTKPMDETMTFVRDGLIGNPKAYSTSNDNTSRLTSVGNAILGYVRNPYDTLSRVENENRAKTVFGQNKYLEHIKNEISAVEDIYKGILGDRSILIEKPISYTRTVTGANRIVADQFTRALEASQTLADPKTGLPGYYMKTPAELEFFWQSNFQRPISMKEMTAYLAVGRIDHFDHILRQVSEYRNKSRLGVQSWSFRTVVEGNEVLSPTFDARQVKTVNLNPDEITLIHDVGGTETYLHSKNPTAQKEFIKLVEEGRFTGVELYDPEKRPIRRADSDGNPLRIRYVFSSSMKSEPLTYDQIGYRGGGHWEYDYDHAVKQSIVKAQRLGARVQHIYEGDNTFGFVSNRAMGEDFAKNMNEVARLIRAKDIPAAKAYAKTVFDIEWKDLYGSFRPSKNPQTGEIKPARFSTDPRQEFRVVPKGRTIFDLDKELEKKYTKTNLKTQVVSSTFVDGTRHGSLARNFQTAYTQARESYDLTEPYNSGTLDKPFYQFRSAKLTDPITVMTRALNRIVNSTYMDDMKISAVEHWLEENKGLLDADINQIRSSPFFYFNEGKFKNNPDNALQRLNAESNRYKIKQLLGQPSKIDTVIHGVKQALSDARYESKGIGKVIKAPLIVPEWMLDKMHNPVDFLRGMTYHLNLGLFALKQVVVQSMAYTTIYGLAGPRLATAGSFGALMHQWTRINRNPTIIAEMDKRATSFGWKPGEFTEANKIMDRIGFGRIGNELSLDNGLRKQSFFRSDAKGILDKGQVFFHEGNLHVRFGAWYTAFKEFRDKYPHVKIGPVEEGQITYRANYLNVLMTRDANTILNKGLVGVPFQFYDFMKKMADVFWSKNIGEAYPTLTKGEDGVYRSSDTTSRRAYVRMRMFLLYAMLGGAAGATGVTGLPFGDTIRKHALEGTLPGQTEAYVPGDHLWSTLVMEGTVSTVVNGLTGNFYNFNNRFNPNGLQVLRDVVQTDPTFWKILLGAMGTTVANEVASMSGFVNAMYSMMEGDPAKEAWPLKIDDWMAPLKNITSWKDGERLTYALAFGKWLDTHGRPVSDVSKIDAIFRTVTGLTDQRIDDMYLKTLTMKDRKAIYDKAFQEFEHESRLAEKAAADGDKEQANDYNKRAFFALTSRNVPVELWPKALSRRATMNRDTIDKNNESYYRQYVPTNLQDKAREADRKIQQMKAK